MLCDLGFRKEESRYFWNNRTYKDVSWDFHIDDTKHQEGFYYHFTQCPLNKYKVLKQRIKEMQ